VHLNGNFNFHHTSLRTRPCISMFLPLVLQNGNPVCQSIHGLCRINLDNWMMIGFVKDEMTLKTTLLVCDPIVISDALVSCVIGLKEKLWLSLTFTTANMVFFTKGSLSCHTNSLLLKHGNAQSNQTTLQFLLSWIYYTSSWLVTRNKVFWFSR